MSSNPVVEQLKAIAREAPESVRQRLEQLGDILSVGNISNSTGIAIGRGIRQVINQIYLPPEAAAALLELRVKLGAGSDFNVEHLQLAPLIAEKIREFVGRQYAFREIDDFLQVQPHGYLTIIGDPGLGKSALIAELARRRGYLVHFNVRSLGVNTAAPFVQSLCAQLVAEAGLPYAGLPEGATENGAFLLKLLKEAAQAIAPEKLVIAIDALDEVDLASHPQGANILFLPKELPLGVYVVMTRRDVDVPLLTSAPQRILKMKDHRDENRADVEAYLARAAAGSALRRWIEGQPPKVDGQPFAAADFVQRLAEISELNFMYLHYVLPEIETGSYRTLSIESLPIGLEGYYLDHWRRMGMEVTPLPRVKIRVLYVLCEAREPVPPDLISQFATNETLGVDVLAVLEVLRDWQQFLTKQQIVTNKRSDKLAVYSVYHASFRDFLHRQDIVQAAGISLPEINRLIANALWDRLFPGASS